MSITATERIQTSHGRAPATESRGLVPGAMNPPESTGSSHIPRVPRPSLRALAIALALSPMEWRVVLLILGMPKPVSSQWIAKRLDLEYSHCKRASRSLVAWNISRRRQTEARQARDEQVRALLLAALALMGKNEQP